MSALESSPVNLSSTIGLVTVCVDNEDIREQILTANKIDISTVPCVLIVYRTGGVEKYEGGNAFQWINETVHKYMPSSPPQQPIPKQPIPKQPAPEPPRKKPRRRKPEPDPDYESSEEDSEPTQRRHPSPQRSRRKHRSSQKPSSSTSIEDLGISGDEEEEEPSNIPSRPPVGVRTGPGGYDITSEFGELQEPNRDASRHMRTSTQAATGKGNDLMAAAMAMQKEREAVEAKQPRAVGNIPTNQRPK